MGLGSRFRQALRSFEDESRRMARYTLAAGGAMMGGSSGAAAGYRFGSTLDDRKYSQQSGTDLGKLRSNAIANGFNPLTVLRATGGQGFYHDQVPMGRLSSDAFFNAFDAYEQINPAVSEELKIDDDVYSNFERMIPVKVGNQMKQLDKTVARRLDILPGDTISPGDLEEILGEFHGNVTSAFATEIQDAVMSGGVLGGYGSVGSIPELSTENFEQNYKSGAIKTSKIRNKYGAYNLSDDPIFQWTQDFFNDAKRSFKENHGS